MTEPQPSPDAQAISAAIRDLADAIRTAAGRPAEPSPPPAPSAMWQVVLPNGRVVEFPVEGDAAEMAKVRGGKVIPPRVPVLDSRRAGVPCRDLSRAREGVDP